MTAAVEQRAWVVLVAAGLTAVVSSCGKDFDCDEATPCGFGETCQGGYCVEARCATSAQCPMESYCLNGECLRGCVEDGDCYPGTSCDLEAKTCMEDACTETSVDCGFREFCNTATGECYDAGDQYCKFCNEDSECGDGNICYAHYCGVNCSQGQECPSGFDCYAFYDDSGNVATYQCFTYCWLYEDDLPGAPIRPAGESLVVETPSAGSP